MLTKADLQPIKELYPNLKHIIENGKEYLKGGLHFKACYNTSSKEFIINPTQDIIVGDTYIEDTFDIIVEFGEGYPEKFPLVREVGGRIQQIVKKYALKDLRDIHVNKNQNNAVCLCSKPAEQLIFPNKVDIVHFFNSLVIPFFYGLSYYEKHQHWLLGEYSHSELGIFESYNEFATTASDQFLLDTFNALRPEFQKLVTDITLPVNRQMLCPVCKNKKFRKCHHEAWLGLKRLKNDYNKSS